MNQLGSFCDWRVSFFQRRKRAKVRRKMMAVVLDAKPKMKPRQSMEITEMGRDWMGKGLPKRARSKSPI